MTPLEHIAQLAAELGATVYESDGRGSRANVTTREVWLDDADAGADYTYWIALHELGHVATTKPMRQDFFQAMFGDPRMTAAEATAWAWALEHGTEELTAEARAGIAYSLGTYVHADGMPAGQGADDLRRVAEIIGAEVDMSLVPWGDQAIAAATWARVVAHTQTALAVTA